MVSTAVYGFSSRFRAITGAESLRHLLRFMTVGLLGTLLDLLIFSTLRLRLGVPALIANTISYGSGTVNNFVLHRRWTFAHWPVKVIGVQFAQFAVVSLSALVVNNLLLLALEPWFNRLYPAEVGEAAAKLCAMGIGMCLSFTINHLWTFRREPALAQSGDSFFAGRVEEK